MNGNTIRNTGVLVTQSAFQSTPFLQIFEILFRLKQSFTALCFGKWTLISTILFLTKKTERFVYTVVILVTIERSELRRKRGVR